MSFAKIGLIGDYNDSVPAHRAIPLSLKRAAEESGISVQLEWVPTEGIASVATVSRFDGLWCVPASPYLSMDGALLAIQYARENALPFLGTCGGFQHAVVEYACNVLGWVDADHAETAPGSSRLVISPLECALVETIGSVRLLPGSRIASAYGAGTATEEYRCRYGLNPEFQSQLVAGPLRVTAVDDSGEVRAIELDRHPFFVATLFQPERAVLRGEPVPLVGAFVRASANDNQRRD
jgi:CTP synthase (UTP-ammonia lyase)